MSHFRNLAFTLALSIAGSSLLHAQPFKEDAKEQGLKGKVHWVKRTWYNPKPGTTEPDKSTIPDLYLRPNQLIEYNEAGKLRAVMDYKAGSNEESGPTERWYYTDGRLTKHAQENANYEAVYTTTHTYDADGHPLKVETKAGPGDKMGLFAGTATTDESTWSAGHQTTLTTRGSDGRLIKTTAFIYDAAGRVTREDYTPTGLYAARTFTYDAQGRVTGETYLDKIGAPASTTTIVYGAIDKPIKRSTTSFYNGQKTGEDVTLMVYNEQGDLTGQKTTKDGKTTAEYRWSHTYDAKENRIETVHFKGTVPEVVEVLELRYY